MQSSYSLNVTLDHNRLVGRRITFIESARFTRSIINCLFASTLILLTGYSSICEAQSESPADTVLAIVNDKQISQAQVDASVFSQVFPLQQQLYAIRKTALENLITKLLLENEAKKRGVSVEGLKKQLTNGPINISSSEVENLYRENASAFGFMSADEAKERLRLDVESQARMRNFREALSKLKTEAKIKLLLDEPRILGVSDDNKAVTRGPKNAAIAIVEFSDFQCPYCKEAQTQLRQVLTEYENEVRLVFKLLPLDTHPQSFASARAAFCAGEQNLFWPFHDALFTSADLSSEALTSVAAAVGLDGAKFKSCLISDRSSRAVLKDVAEAKALGINSTPTFVINGRLIRGAVSFDALKKIIDRDLGKPMSSSGLKKDASTN